jgi:cyclic dehypoxanthinyl futalosine synthase
MQKILEKAAAHERISEDEALKLYNEAEFLELGAVADARRKHVNPENLVTFVIDRNINYTNVCSSGCLFCAFYCKPEDGDGYVLTKDELSHKIEETLALGGTQILLQGGMNPELGLDYYIDLLSFIKKNFRIHIHGFSPPEVSWLASKSGLSVSSVIEKLIDAGLDSIPGGGAEILVDEIRSQISPNKCTADEWLGVMREAHSHGLRTTATMMFGHYEKPEHIIRHLAVLRNLQDETGGFTAFIPWTFQPGNTRMPRTAATSAEYLKVLSLSRIFLDNFKSIQASWVTQGAKIAQISLFFGANDMGSTMIEENVVAAAGVKFRLPMEEMIRIIKTAGFEACQRDCHYNILRTFGNDA